MNKKELLAKVEYNEKFDPIGQVHMPNELFKVLSNKELFKVTKTRKMVDGKREKVEGEKSSVQSPHNAVTYSYLFYIAWLYRNYKYGVMNDENTDVGAIKEVLGYSKNSKAIDYIIKKDGITDQLGYTRTLAYKHAPVEYNFVGENMIQLFTIEEVEEIEGKEQAQHYKSKNRRKTVKYPVWCLEDMNDETHEVGFGTFYGYIDNTTQIDFMVFAECMSNEKLGCVAFYLYSFLKWKCDVSGTGVVEISHEKLMADTGLSHYSLNNTLHYLKAFNLINCKPATFYVGTGKTDGASIYAVNEPQHFRSEEQKYETRNIVIVEDEEEEQEK